MRIRPCCSAASAPPATRATGCAWGGPGNCCGVIQFRTADLDTSGRIGYRTTDRFAETGIGCAEVEAQLFQFGVGHADLGVALRRFAGGSWQRMHV